MFFIKFNFPENIAEYNKPKLILKYTNSGLTVELVALLIYFLIVNVLTKIIMNKAVETLRHLNII